MIYVSTPELILGAAVLVLAATNLLSLRALSKARRQPKTLKRGFVEKYGRTFSISMLVTVGALVGGGYLVVKGRVDDAKGLFGWATASQVGYAGANQIRDAVVGKAQASVQPD